MVKVCGATHVQEFVNTGICWSARPFYFLETNLFMAVHGQLKHLQGHCRHVECSGCLC